ncbi:MAG TPA: EAL domain-containing protein [Acidimicrobiales bacterium]
MTQGDDALHRSVLPDGLVAERAPIGVLELDADGRVLMSNPAFGRLAEVSAADITGRLLPDLLHPADRGLAALPRAADETTTWAARVGLPDGTHRQVRFHLSNRPDTDTVLVFAEEVRTPRPPTLLPEAAEGRSVKPPTDIDDIVTLCDAEGVIEKILGPFEALLGWSPHEWERRPVFDLVHPDEVERFRAEHERMLAAPCVPFVHEIRMRRRSGEWIWLELTTTNLLDDPSVGAVIVVSSSVSAQRRIELLNSTQAEVLELIACGAQLDIVLSRLAQMVEENTRGATVAVVLREADVLRLGSAHRLDPRLIDLLDGASVSQWSGAVRSALLGGRTVSSSVGDADLDAVTRDVLHDLGVNAFTAIPIARTPDGDRASGVLLVLLHDDRRLEHHEEIVVANAARLAAIAVQRHQAELRLSHLAHHDKLTGLPNRVLLQARLDEGINHARTHNSSIAVMFLDLDNFKIVNDSFGHAAGDQVLVGFAERFRKLLRPGDVLGRFGGDEFVVLLENVSSASDATPVAERLLEDLKRPFRLRDNPVFLTVSVGIAVSQGGRDSSEVLLRNADAAMYQAKERGRSRIEIYDEGLPGRAAHRLQIEGDLHHALEAGQFVLHWQPKIALDTGRIISAEALLRWQHPERGLLLPAEFVSITEELELIHRIGEWVLADAIRQRAQWQDEHGDEAPWSIAVNVSALQLAGPKVVDTVERVLSRWQWAPERLVLELTESVLMDESTEAHAMLARLKELGVQLAIDDFGTGYSSLSYLHRFPVDQVKLDRAFVANLRADGEGSPIACAVVNMAHALGISVTAEGVETEQQLLGLRAIGCDRAQGFYIARPMPADEFTALLARKPRYLPQG